MGKDLERVSITAAVTAAAIGFGTLFLKAVCRRHRPALRDVRTDEPASTDDAVPERSSSDSTDDLPALREQVASTRATEDELPEGKLMEVEEKVSADPTNESAFTDDAVPDRSSSDLSGTASPAQAFLATFESLRRATDSGDGLEQLRDDVVQELRAVQDLRLHKHFAR